jgi:galactokinase
MIEQLRERFGSAEGVRVFRAPGRVNLIGEHTDYNQGLVLPVALELATFVAGAPSGDSRLRIYSEHKREMREWQVTAVADLQPRKDWTDYPIGVAQQLIRAGFPAEPANFLIRSAVPEGSGLSSSAALEVSMALAFLRGRALARVDLARLCQRAERQFVGIPSGIMDQYVSLFGKEHSAIELDCRSLEHRLVSLPDRITFGAVNSMVKHALASSAYKERVHECARAVEGIRVRYPDVQSLRDVTEEQFASCEAALGPVIGRRVRHVITENTRVERFAAACRERNLRAMGELLVESHRSLQQDYEVSCEELDFLVDAALAVEGTYGARMTGGGFGGCIVAMLQTGAWKPFCEQISRAYRRQFGITPEVYRCQPAPGASEVRNFETIPAAA